MAQAQDDINANISSIRQVAAAGGDNSSLAAAELQLQSLNGLQHRIGRADGTALRSISGEVAAITTAAQFVAQQARATTAQSAEATLQQARAAARQSVSAFVDDYYGRKIFDPYLRFASLEEEQAFRDREEARRKAIEAARAEGTPQGELRALRLTREQLQDAGNYGAANSPDFQRYAQQAESAEQALTASLAAQPSSNVIASEKAAQNTLSEQGPALVSPDIVAALRATGAVLGDSGKAGHGVNSSKPAVADCGVVL